MEPSGLKANNFPPTDLKAVIFDMDGLLLDSEPLYRIAWREAAASFGFEISDELYGRLLGYSNGEAERKLASLVERPFPIDEFSRLRASSEERVFQTETVPMKPGALELIECLTRAKIRRAVATSTARRKAIPLLERTELLRHFEAVVCGDEIARSKPAPDIFIECIRRLDVQPGSCIVLEDSEAGIRAAHAAGIPAVMVPDLKQPSDEIAALAALVTASLIDLRQTFDPSCV